MKVSQYSPELIKFMGNNQEKINFFSQTNIHFINEKGNIIHVLKFDIYLKSCFIQVATPVWNIKWYSGWTQIISSIGGYHKTKIYI
jgi:hypothetical protein